MSNTAAWYGQLPIPIRTVLLDCQAWVVGSGALWVLGERNDRPRDLDIVVPPPFWMAACRALNAINPGVHLNTFGGFKLKSDENYFDVWPMHLEEYFTITPKTQRHVAFRWLPRCVVEEPNRIEPK